MRHLLLFMLILAMASVAVAQDDTDLPGVDDLEDGWNIIETGEETMCSRDTPYQFYARNGESNNLMVYFQGGGACWDLVTCTVDGGAFDDTVTDEEIINYNGIFAFDNPENPIADYSVVFVPYCTADIHIGDSAIEYGDETINHNGFNNSVTVLDWVYANYDAPETIFITGSSAGAYGAIYHAPYIINQYPESDAVVLGDAGVGITPPGWSVLTENWNMFENMPEFVPDLANTDPETFTTSVLYQENAAQYADARFAQFTNYADEVQIIFYQFSGRRHTPQDWIDGMYAALDNLDALDNFSSYVAPGSGHTILALPDFYTLEVEGVSMVDWLSNLLAGEQPDSVRCVECEVAEAEDEE